MPAAAFEALLAADCVAMPSAEAPVASNAALT
jgi:hypothetical protein